MMDPSNLSLADGLESVHQNGANEEPYNFGKDGGLSNDVDPSVAEITEMEAPNGNVENFNQLDSTAIDNSSVANNREGSNDNRDGDNVNISNEEDVKIIDQPEQLRARQGPVKNKNAKAPNPRVVNASASSVKRSKDGKVEQASSAVANGTLASDSHPRQPIKSRSFNDKQTRLSKHPGKSDAASAEVPMDKTKPRSVKKGTHDNVQVEAEPSSPTSADGKPRRVGALPNYGFSFKCDQRAARRKEFYSKLEEKIHAKEVEESNLQAKTKETQEAEIKMLRKSLGFKANPMPSFYQEPPPPRVELKKIPTTRAKSPKLGRRKSLTHPESEGNSSSAGLGRLSLDEKVSQSSPTKGTSPANQKKPQRRSLPPRLTSERSSSSNSVTARTPSKAANDVKTSSSSVTKVTNSSIATGEDKVEVAAASEENGTLADETSEALTLNVAPSDNLNEAECCANGNIVPEENPEELTSVQEPIAAEN